MEPFQRGLRELGYIDGQNIRLEYHSAEQRYDRAAEIAAALVQRDVDIIIALATSAAHAAKSATATIPIVISVADPLATGLVASLARPGGNLTGVTTTSPDLAGKRLEILRDIRHDTTSRFPGGRQRSQHRYFRSGDARGRAADGVRLHPVLVTGPEEFESAFVTMKKEQVEGLIVQPLFVGHRARLSQLALQNRLPLIADQPVFAESGALAAYGIDRDILFRRPAYYVAESSRVTSRPIFRWSNPQRTSSR